MLVFGKFDLSTKLTVCLHWFLVRYCEILRITQHLCYFRFIKAHISNKVRHT